jgi:hypothetical protein
VENPELVVSAEGPTHPFYEVITANLLVVRTRGEWYISVNHAYRYSQRD